MHRFTFFHSFSLIVSLDLVVILDIIVFFCCPVFGIYIWLSICFGWCTEEVTIQICSLMRRVDVFLSKSIWHTCLYIINFSHFQIHLHSQSSSLPQKFLLRSWLWVYYSEQFKIQNGHLGLWFAKNVWLLLQSNSKSKICALCLWSSLKRGVFQKCS